MLGRGMDGWGDRTDGWAGRPAQGGGHGHEKGDSSKDEEKGGVSVGGGLGWVALVGAGGKLQVEAGALSGKLL